MAFSNNQFPVFLRIAQDGSVTTEIRKFEDFVHASGRRAADAFSQAGRNAGDGWDFATMRRQLRDLEAEAKRVASVAASGVRND